TVVTRDYSPRPPCCSGAPSWAPAPCPISPRRAAPFEQFRSQPRQQLGVQPQVRPVLDGVALLGGSRAVSVLRDGPLLAVVEVALILTTPSSVRRVRRERASRVRDRRRHAGLVSLPQRRHREADPHANAPRAPELVSH